MEICERWLSHFDLAGGLGVGFMGDEGGFDGVLAGVGAVDGRGVEGVGTVDGTVGGCCVGGFDVAVVVKVEVDMTRLRFGDVLSS